MNDLNSIRQIEKENNIVLKKLTEEELKNPSFLNSYRGYYCDEEDSVIGLRLDELNEFNPGALSGLTYLQFLSVIHFPLSDITFLSKLKGLTHLDLSFNKISDYSFLSELKGLTYLDLSENKISDISFLSELKGLTYLDLSENQINDISFLSKLKGLTYLYLSENKISDISFLSELKGLTHLYLRSNKISDISFLSKLKGLTHLYLSNNKLKRLPIEFIELKKLKNLYVYNNPFVDLPLEIVAKGIEEIRKYFRQIKEKGEDYIYEAKLLLVGEPGAGKTTLAKKIENPEYKLKKNEKSTEGIDIIEWKFRMENGKDFRVNIWDFGGQEIYHATHQFFLTKRSLYILVADTRKEDTDFNYWLNVVRLLSDNSPLIIVKNEKQDRQREINERQLRGEFENLKETLATNLDTNRGLTEIMDNIRYYILHLPHIGSALPKTWVNVREILEKDERNYISFDEYLKICDDNGFTRKEDKLQLSGYLHDLGVCLHFQDDPVLKNTVIIKPEWGTAAVYEVLDTIKIQNNFGRFTGEDLTDIWNEPQYEYKHAELLQLMMKFELCYMIPIGDDTYIAPQLLSENQPEYEWDNEKNLIMRYIYEFMPRGIVTRFIVRLHHYIINQELVWKQGAILDKDNTKAEVIENYSKREIKIRIQGNHKKELMTTVRYELDEINNSFHNQLAVQRYVPCNCPKCKDTQDPHFYLFEILQNFIEGKQRDIQCQKSFKMVNVQCLIDDIESKEYIKRYEQEKEEKENIKEKKTMPSTIEEKLESKKGEIEEILGEWGFPIKQGTRDIKRAEIKNWFSNFKASEFDDMFLLMKKIKFYSHSQLKEMIKKLSIEKKKIFDNDLSNILFFSMEEFPGSSGASLLYNYHQDLELTEEAFPNSLKKITGKTKALVFFDDIIGSGNQAITVANKRLKDIKVDKYYVVFLAYEKGLEKIKNEAGFKDVICAKKLSDEEKAFTEVSSFFQQKIERERIKKICEKYGETLYKYPLGYDDSEALIVFEQNTPNNTLPIIWAGEKSESKKGKIWYPLWERKKKYPSN